MDVTSSAKIVIEGLTRDYGRNRGVFDLSLTVAAGETFGFLGPNGAGKTTVIRHLMGFIRARVGSCTIDGRDCFSERHAIQASVGYIPGEIAFFDDLTGRAYLEFLSSYRGLGHKRKDELLERFELDPGLQIKKMSKGMKQKLAVVGAFMHDPSLLILDEPTSGLDPLMQNRFIALLEDEKRRGKTIFLSSHMFEEVERTCHRIGIIRDGRLVALDHTAALREKHVRRFTVTLPSPELAADFAAAYDGVLDGCSVTVQQRQSLEAIFLEHYGEHGHA